MSRSMRTIQIAWSRVWQATTRHVSIAPWNEICIDLIGSWKVQVQGEEMELNALPCIDPVTNLVELI